MRRMYDDTVHGYAETDDLIMEFEGDRTWTLYSEHDTNYHEAQDVTVTGTLILTYGCPNQWHTITVPVDADHHWVFEWMESAFDFDAHMIEEIF